MDLTAVFKILLSLSFMGSILAGIILLMKGLFKNKLNANWHYYIWLLLAIRLILPYAPESSLSVFNLLPPIAQSIGISQNVSENHNSDISLSPVNEAAVVNDAEADINSLQNELVQKENIPVPQKSGWGFNFQTASIIWLLGVAAILLYICIVNSVFLLRTRKRHRCKEEDILNIFEECKAKMNVHAELPIIYDKSLKTPSLFGLVRPKLIIPSEVIENLSKEEIRYVFLHELAHFKRKDILINWITVLIQALHWFNPVIWYVFYKMHEDCEVACDAYVLARLNPVEHRKYGETIINLINKISRPYWNPVTTGMANNRSSIKRRIKMITIFKKSSWKWSIIAVIIMITLGFVGLTNSKGAAGANNDKANTLSKNFIDFNKDSHDESLIVKMTDGRYYEDTAPGPYMGSNWEGKFYIQLIDDKGNVTSELDLNKAFNEQKLSFQNAFSIEFDDYNNDGNMDFTIGQYASSNGNIYKLFTISPNGKIEALVIKGQPEIFSSGGNRYSKKFKKIGTATFISQYYDNSKGKMVENYYSWSDKENKFVIKPVNGDAPQSESQDKQNIRDKDSNDKGWEVVSRADRVQGTITALDMTENMLNSVTLKGTKRIILPNNPIDYDFTGKTFNIVFNEDMERSGIVKGKLKKGAEIVITFAQYAIPPEGKVVDGAYLSDILFFENGRYYNIKGNEIELEPASDQEFATKPKIEVPVDLEIEKFEQQQVDEGHKPWRLDPIQTTITFVSLKISPEGVEGPFPVKVEDLKIIQQTDKVAIVEVSGDKTPISRVYLKRLIRQDNTGIWSVVGYD